MCRNLAQFNELVVPSKLYPFDVYIGRPSIWGNPFRIGPDGTREDVVAKYREWITTQPALIARARRELAGKVLGCHCAAGLACHGHVLAQIANATPEELAAPPAEERGRIVFAFGSRDVVDGRLVSLALEHFHKIHHFTELRSGGARGADALAAAWARARGLSVIEYLAQWTTPDGKYQPQAGAARTGQLVAELPAGSICIGFADVDKPASGRARDHLTPGTRITVGLCLKAGLETWIVWRCGSRTRVTGDTGPRLPFPGETNHAQRRDAAENDALDMGEDGFDATANTGRPVDRWYAAPTAPTTRRVGEVFTENGRTYRVTAIRGNTAIITRCRSLHYREDLGGADAAPFFGDLERRSAEPLRSRAPFTSGHTATDSTCRMCGEITSYNDGLCSDCAERLGQ